MKRFWNLIITGLFLSIPILTNAQVTTIRTVVHIIRPSGGGGMTDQEAENAIALLNDFYSRTFTNMKFVVDEIKAIQTTNTTFNFQFVNCSSISPGLIESPQVQNALNIYFYPSLQYGAAGVTFTVPGNTCVISYSAAQSSTVAHEVGHCFGLYHTDEFECFGKENNPGCTSNCTTAGDKICDTPAQRNPSGPSTDNCGIAYPTTNPNYGNIMDLQTGGGARTYFTSGQRQKINSVLQTTLSSLKFFVSVTASNKINNVNQSGTTLNFDGANVNSGSSINLLYGLNHISKTNHEILSTNYKHHNWDGDFKQFKLTENYDIKKSDLTRTANFIQLNIVNIKNSLTEVSGSDLGIKELKDPWRVSGGSQPNVFDPLSASSVNVFLGQNPNFLPDLPTYYIRGSLSQPIYLSQTGKTHTFYFQSWSVSNAVLQFPNNNETAVTFASVNATVTANLKGHLLTNSTAAISSNSQRKIVSDGNGYKHMVYESMGSVWYTRSTDNGVTWSAEQKVNVSNSSAISPSIACSNDGNNLIYITYQSDKTAVEA